jgi:hypothetical protein
VVKRFKKHKPKTYRAAAALLKTGAMPSLLFSAGMRDVKVNPAMLYMMHASSSPSPAAGTSQPDSSRWCGPQETDSLAQHNTAAEVFKGAVGEIWWLFDSGRPYLAEVFQGDNVPEGRLPHVDRGGITGKTIARIIGRRTHFIKVVAPKARRYPFSAWYDTCLSLVRGCCQKVHRRPVQTPHIPIYL